VVIFRPIGEAPVQPGIRFGPCVLGPGLNGEDWVVGFWDGYAWICRDGFSFTPTVFFLLGPVSEILAALGLAPLSTA